MSTTKTAMTYFGGGVALAGIAVAASFIGRGANPDPIAEWFLGPLPFVFELVGVAAGLLIALLGVVVAVRLGDERKVAAVFERREE